MYHELPLQDFLKSLLAIALEKRTGTIFFVTEDEGWGKVAFDKGEIVSLGYKMKWGLDALPLIHEIDKAQFYFRPQELHLAQAQRLSGLSNQDIFLYFGINYDRALEANKQRSAPSVSGAATASAMPQPSISAAARGARSADPLNVSVEHKPKILVADDSGIARKSISRVLLAANYEVIEARDGFEALGQIENEHPDLVVLDLIMPGIDGYQVLHMMKKNSQTRDLPVIILTSRDSLMDKLKGKMSESDEYLTKPFEPETLLQKVNKYLA